MFLFFQATTLQQSVAVEGRDWCPSGLDTKVIGAPQCFQLLWALLSTLLKHRTMNRLSLNHSISIIKSIIMAVPGSVLFLNTFASFMRKTFPFFLKNASNLTHEFLYDNFTKKILLNFIDKIVIKNLCVKFEVFSTQNGSFFFL